MSISDPDYGKIYKIQDKVLQLIVKELDDFYLTGGTALGRFYLHHRYSDDLDFFVHKDNKFDKKVNAIFNVLKSNYKINETVTILTPEFARINILEDAQLKIEFVNDIAFRWGKTIRTQSNIPVDNVANILANKLTALVSRDEPKDVFDIINIAGFYHFNWKEIYKYAFEKQIMNETDVSMRLATFPVEWIEDKPWLNDKVNLADLKNQLETIADDFLFARDNSLGKGKIHITEARPRKLQ